MKREIFVSLASRRRSRRRSQAGSSTATILFLLVGVATVGTSMAKLADTASRVAHKSDQKMQANALAESAAEQMWAQVCSAENSGGTYPSTLSTTTLTSTIGSSTQTVGTYNATATLYSTTTVNSTQTKYTFQIDGYGTTTGTASAGSSSHVRAFYSGVLTSTTSLGVSSSLVAFGGGAIQVNGLLTVKSDGQISTQDSASLNTANIVANGGVSWVPYSNSRSANANNNNIVLAGQMLVPALTLAASAWNYTNSTSTGVFKTYNNATVKVFQTPSDVLNGIPLVNTLQGMLSLASFPSATQVSVWDGIWKSQGQLGTQYGSTISFNNGSGSDSALRNAQTGEYRITAPAYINGDLNINSGQLYLQPNSDITKSNVVYVTGNVTNSALLYNRGVKLVILGSYADTSSGHYQLQTQYTNYSMTQLYAITALIAEKASPSAITLGSNASSDMGLLYAANGGFTINSSMWVTGALVAGGTGSNSGMAITTQGGGFGVKYQATAVIGRNLDFPITVSTVATNYFTATQTGRMSWNQML